MIPNRITDPNRDRKEAASSRGTRCVEPIPITPSPFQGEGRGEGFWNRLLARKEATRSLLVVALLSFSHAAAIHPDPTDPIHPSTVAADEPESQDDKPKSDDSKEKEADKWDVNNPPGPKFDIPIDTDSGTWMNLDVSPDGRQIAFDLLGDLYLLPIAGGDAQPLTSGMAWDMQPRFSPDGRLLAFTSDRGNGDNLWTIKLDGTDPKQITKEDFRLLNAPVWTPDGQYLAARKHFTSKRSLGAGEIWLYHHSGGGGLQMTKKANDQKDLGEPAFSPDGRYLYYSQDVTPGGVFEYNKDPNDEIYAIQRLDRQTGETERWVSAPGGSIRPTPSPDGKRLAFIRRVRARSVLFLQDLPSGREWPLYDGLDRDMQETWAIHGVYPTMAWTPDSRHLVFWAGGKIRRIDIETQAVTDIPFQVRGTRTACEALRFPVTVAPDPFDVKMLRWTAVSPRGDAVVYQALGYLYLRALPDGVPKRLTTQSDHFECFPAFSRDGRSIVYTTWNDRTLGTIRIAPAAGGEGRVISDEPGHYLEPVFTPNGDKVVYRKGRGGYIRSPLWSRNPGIYVLPAAGGKPVLVTKNGTQPQFGADPDRVYLLQVEEKDEKDRRILVSMDLDGSDLRTHYVSENATEYRMAPDERWLAFTERFNAYLTPHTPTGKEVEISPTTTAIPLKKVSRDAGQYLHWSGDSTRLHWSLGPELYTRELKDAFDFVDGAPAPLPEPAEQGRPISFSQPADVPEGTVALVGARIITMKGDEVIDDGTIVLERNRIAAVGPRATVAPPPGATVLDVSGTTIIPGLIDVHAHGPHGTDEIIPQRNWMHYANLAFGVTTIHDPSNDTETIFASAEMARAGSIVAPRVFSTGTILYGAAGWFKAEVATLDDARSHLRRMKAVGALSVKSYNQPRRDQRQKVVAAARELEMMVVPEGGSTLQHNLTMIVDGHTGIEHAIPVAQAYDDIRRLWSATEVGFTPTLVVAYGGIWGENYWYQHTEVWANERLGAFVPRFVLDPRSRRRFLAPADEFNHVAAARWCAELVHSGGKVQLGAHGQLAGIAAHWELWMFSQGGMTPLEAIRAATLDGARYLGLDGDVGSLEPGKLADLVVLERNPLQDIRNSEFVRYTVLNGRVFQASDMQQIGNHPQPPPSFFWQVGSEN